MVVRPRPPRPLSAPVHSRGHRFPSLLLLGLLALLPAAGQGAALAQDDPRPKAEGKREGDGKKGEEKGKDGKKGVGKDETADERR